MSTIASDKPSIDIHAVSDDLTAKDTKTHLLEGRSDEQPEARTISLETVPASTRRGITLRSLRAIEATVKGLVTDGRFPTVSCYTELTTTDLVYGWVKEVTGFSRFVDCPNLFNFADAGVPQYFVSHAWKGSFALLVAHVLAHLKNASEDTRVWLDMFAVNQHGGPKDPPEAQQENRDDVASFKATLRGCLGTIVVVDLPRCNPATRGWCLYEWDKTITFLGLEALLFVGVSGKDLNQIVDGVSVATAECFSPQDLAMIQKEVEENHGSLAAFDESLKLVLLFTPTSYKLDLKQLDLRSAGTLWNFDAVRLWLEDPAAPRTLCILSGAGTGKSSVSAALLRMVLGRPMAGRPGEWVGPPTAFHFLKHCDQRRLEPVAILKSLACQLGRHLFGLAAALCALGGQAMANLTTIESACGLLLKPLAAACAEHGGPVVILVDALDEADPPEQQRPGFDPATNHIEPVANKAVHLVLAELAPKLPANVRFIFSARPDTLLGTIKPVLDRAFLGGVLYLRPNALRSGSGAVRSGTSEESNLVYQTVVRGCQLEGILEEPSGAPGLRDVYNAYAVAFSRAPPEDGERRLLEVALAAFEPLPVSLLQQIGLHVHLKALPGWGTLFYEADHHLHVIHKSLSDWLSFEWLPQRVKVESGDGGHGLLGAHLLEREVLTATDAGETGGVVASVYALKYAVPHLVLSMGAGATQANAVDRALGQWPFIRQAFLAGYGAKLVAVLGCAEADNGLSDYGVDALRWLRRCFNDFERNATAMEVVTMREAPIFSLKYKEACARLQTSYSAAEGPHMPRTASVLGRVSKMSWPTDTNIFKGHSGHIGSVVFSPNGRSLATGSNDKTARVWDLVSGQCTATLEGHSEWVASVAFSPDGRLLATGSKDKTARVWDLTSGQCTATFEGHSGGVRSVSFSPDGGFLATGSFDETSRVWNLANGQCTTALEGHTGGVYNVEFSPDGGSLATGSEDETARVWDLANGKCIAIFEGHSEGVTSVTFSPDGHSLATCSDDKTARVWVLASGQCIATFKGHSNCVTSVAFSPDGRSLATGSEDMTARVWVLASRQCIATFEGHSNCVTSVAFNPDGHSLATASDDKTVRVWDLTSEQCTATLEGHSRFITSVAFSPDGRSLATGSLDKSVRVWDLASEQCTATLEGHSRFITSVAFSPDGCSLATGSEDKTAWVWDLNSGQCSTTLEGHSNCVTSVVFSPDRRSLATGSEDETARVWDLASGHCTATLDGHSGGVTSVAFSPDGHSLATGSRDKIARVWNLTSERWTATFEGHLGSITSVALSPDKRSLATGSDDKSARVWDLASGQCTATLEGHSDYVTSVAFSPDGASLTTGSTDSTARVWALASGQCTATFVGHLASITSVAFSPNGRSLATGSNDKSARIWDLASGQ